MARTAGTRSERKRRAPDLGILAGRLLFAIERELFARLAEEGHPHLRPRHGAVLAYLDEQGSRATDLVGLRGRHKQTIGVIVDELAALGYVTREPDPSDRRAKLVVPTEQGIDEMHRSDAIMAQIERRHARALGAESWRTFHDLLREVERAQRHRARDLPG